MHRVFQQTRRADRQRCFDAPDDELEVDQQALVQDERFFVSPYVGKHGWTSVYLDKRVSWKVLEDLVRRSYRLIAPKRLVAALDGEPPRGAKKKARRKASRKR